MAFLPAGSEPPRGEATIRSGVKHPPIAPADAAAAPEALALAPAEAEALAVEAGAFAQALPDPRARARYQRLADCAATDARVPPDLLPALETMLDLVLQTDGGPTARQPLHALFARTPRGHALAAQARQVTHALRALRGQRLDDLRLTAGPGRHTLTIQTDHCRLTLELGPRGAAITSLEAG